jgi:hypothetical protein
MPAPVASGWSESPGGACTHWKAPPCHGAHPMRTSEVGSGFDEGSDVTARRTSRKRKQCGGGDCRAGDRADRRYRQHCGHHGTRRSHPLRSGGDSCSTGGFCRSRRMRPLLPRRMRELRRERAICRPRSIPHRSIFLEPSRVVGWNCQHLTQSKETGCHAIAHLLNSAQD